MGSKALLGFAKNLVLDEARTILSSGNRARMVGCILFHSLILSAHRTDVANLSKPTVKLKHFGGARSLTLMAQCI